MTDEEKTKEIEEDNNMRYLVRKIVYTHAEDYTIDEIKKDYVLASMKNEF